MAPPKSYAIPEGWVMQKKVESNGTEVECFFCVATGQEFCTYNGMMRYVHYAIAREASIYSPDFTPPQKLASSKREKQKASFKRGSNAPKEVGSSKRGSNPRSNLKIDHKLSLKKKKPAVSSLSRLSSSPN